MKGSHRVPIERFEEGQRRKKSDWLSREEPLEMRIGSYSLNLTMRTPGNDFELVAGFLYSEGIISATEELESMTYCVNKQDQEYNIVSARLRTSFDPEQHRRNFLSHAGCGLCGKTTLDQLEQQLCAPRPGPKWEDEQLLLLPERLREAQRQFSKTGGLHACAAVGFEDLTLREDVGRHNACDKLIGHLLLEKKLPAQPWLLLLSGRASFELIQKGIRAGFSTIAALGAPSTLAVEMAQRFRVRLIGFLKPNSFNEYSVSD